MMEEQWKDIEGYDGRYSVSTLGRVRNNKSGRFLRSHSNKNGYRNFYLYLKGTKKTCLAHRLVAETYIENPYNKPQVNHMDGVRDNNALSNLEWMTAKENVQESMSREAFHRGRKLVGELKKKTVKLTNVVSGEEFIYNSVTEAGEAIGATRSLVGQACNGRIKAAKGYLCEFI